MGDTEEGIQGRFGTRADEDPRPSGLGNGFRRPRCGGSVADGYNCDHARQA